jgi:hypothetical protein
VWTFPSLHVLDRHEVTEEERQAALKKFGKVSQDLVAFGKRTTKWENPPAIPLAALSATASDMYKELERVRARVEAAEASKSGVAGVAGVAGAGEGGQASGSKHVRNDYVTVMKWSNPAVELAAGSSSAAQQPLPQALATAVLSASASSALALDQAKYAQCAAHLHVFAPPSFVLLCSGVRDARHLRRPFALCTVMARDRHSFSGTSGAKLLPTPPHWRQPSCSCDAALQFRVFDMPPCLPSACARSPRV